MYVGDRLFRRCILDKANYPSVCEMISRDHFKRLIKSIMQDVVVLPIYSQASANMISS